MIRCMFNRTNEIHKCFNKYTNTIRLLSSPKRKLNVSCLICATGITVEVKNHKFTAEEDFLPDHIIKRAAAHTVDSACTLVNQVTTTFLDTLEEYVHAMETLIRLMEMNINALGSNAQEDQVWDSILDVRAIVVESKKRKLELELMYAMAEKTLNAAAEAAFLSGSDYHGIVGGDCVRLAQSKIQEQMKKCTEVEAYLQEMEIKSIEETSKHAKETEKSKQPTDDNNEDS